MMKSGITIITVEHQEQGLNAAKDILYEKVDNQTLLLLSGGSTPKDLYKTLAQEGKIKAKAVGMVDERADGSNERMIKETGLLLYFEKKKIPFYPILRLHPKGVASDIARDYNEEIKHLLEHFSKNIAIMGIGADGHTAGLPAKTQNLELPTSLKLRGASKTQNYVERINNFPGEFKERITLTFKALSKMDLLIVLAFGSAKQNALTWMFDPSAGSGQAAIEEIPARFYTQPQIAKKTVLITDQKI